MNHVTTTSVHVGTTPPRTAAEQSAVAYADLFAQDAQEYGAPNFSRLNPDGIRNNCVLVTLAYLMGLRSVNELNPQIQATFQAEQKPDGIIRKTILKILELTGREFRYEPWKFKPVKLAEAEAEAAQKYREAKELCDEEGITEAEAAQRYRKAKELCDRQNVAEAEAAKRRHDATDFCVKCGVEEIGIWYVRLDSKNKVKSGHCIVLKDYFSGKGSDGGRIVMPGAFPEQYVDYQKSSAGDDRWSEVRGDWLTQIGKQGVQSDKLRVFVVGAFALTTPQTG
ncbi:hypothetical protein KC349_g2276 [Hortaea werneckii]|nr:hypothetical protein KC349_g2276 [Hortaea werneckii]